LHFKILKLPSEPLPAYFEKHADKIVWALIIAYTVFFSAYTINMHYTFRTYAWDLGILTQSLWTTLNSDKTMYSTLEVHYGNPTGNFLGVHFSPILFAVLPIYALYQSPETLLVFQSFVLAVAALPLYWIARDKLQNKLYALAFSTAYLLNPAIHGVNTFDFHLEIFTPVFILFAFYYIDKGKWLKAIPFIALELTTLEFAPIIVLSLGFYFFLKKLGEVVSNRENKFKSVKKLAPPVMLMLVSVFSFYLAVHVIQTINPLKTGGPPGVWSYWGSNIFEVANNVIRNPAEAITTMITPLEKPYFIIFLLGSALFLPLLAPIELIISLPWIIAALLSDYAPYYQPYYQYSAFVVGQISVAAIYGFRRLFSTYNAENNGRKQKKVLLALLIGDLLLFATISPVGIPAFTQRTLRPYSISSVFDQNHVEKLHKAISLLPANASVATIWDIFPHVCQRLDAYFLDQYFSEHPGDYPAEYILVDMKSPCLTLRIYGPTPYEVLLGLMKSGKYGVIASLDGVMLLQKGYHGSPRYYEPQKDTFNHNYMIPLTGKITWDYTSPSKKVIISNLDNSIGIVWYGPYKYFAPGTYTATFRIKTTNETGTLLLDVARGRYDVSEEQVILIANRTIYLKDFKHTNDWEDFSLSFKIDLPARLEFRGTLLSNNTQIVLDCVIVEQLNP